MEINSNRQIEEMRRRFSEGAVRFLDILKWTILATVIGVITGLATTGFIKLLNWSTDFTNQYPYYFIFLPIILVLNAVFLYKIFPSSDCHTTNKVIEAIHKLLPISFASIIKAFFAPILTIAGGGSAGKEAPCADIGAGFGSILSRILRLSDADRRKLMICGVSAGFASVFGTPIAGAIFGVEVLFVGSLLYEVLFPSFVAGIIGYHVSSGLGITYFYSPLKLIPVFTKFFFFKVILSGIFFGICSLLLIETMKLFQKIFENMKLNIIYKALIGGTVLVALTFLFTVKYNGLGIETIQSCLKGEGIVWYAFLLKIVFTAITLSFCGSGGIITPIFFIGATAGSLFANALRLDSATFSAIGLVAILSGAAKTPIAASILAVEIFGAEIVPYAATACIISFLMTGKISVFSSQVIGVEKT